MDKKTFFSTFFPFFSLDLVPVLNQDSQVSIIEKVIGINLKSSFQENYKNYYY